MLCDVKDATEVVLMQRSRSNDAWLAIKQLNTQVHFTNHGISVAGALRDNFAGDESREGRAILSLAETERANPTHRTTFLARPIGTITRNSLEE
jgi:hypothetical protein